MLASTFLLVLHKAKKVEEKVVIFCRICGSKTEIHLYLRDKLFEKTTHLFCTFFTRGVAPGWTIAGAYHLEVKISPWSNVPAAALNTAYYNLFHSSRQYRKHLLLYGRTDKL